jgi:hypothetical protein
MVARRCALASKSPQTTCEITESKSKRGSARAKTMTSATQVAGESMQSKRAREGAGHPNESRRGCRDRQGARRRRTYRRQGVCCRPTPTDRQGPSRVSRQGRRQFAPGYSSGLRRPGQPSLYARSKGKLAAELGVVNFRSSPVRAGLQGQAAGADRQA